MTKPWLLISILLANLPSTLATEPTTKVLIVGTFHMANPGLDLLNPSVKDVLGPRRQKKIIEVATRLEKFRPTKIAVEVRPDSPVLQKRLDRYLAGQFALTADETDQIALRLAKNLKLRALDGIDSSADLDFDGVMAYAEKHGQSSLVQSMMADLEKMKQKMTPAYMEQHSVREILLDANSSQADDFGQNLYMSLLKIGKGGDYPGADLVSRWYQRNLRIATNIARLADPPGQRILVLIGSGHGKLLRQFIAEMPGFEVVRCSDYLK